MRALSFDLFDTLVDQSFRGLPVVVVDGRQVRSTAPWLHEALKQRVGVEFDVFAGALRDVDRELVGARYAEGRECPSEERFAEVLTRLGVCDPAATELLVETHMAAIAERVSVPDHHEALLRELGSRLPLALCSNFTHSPTAERVMEAGGLRAHLQVELVSDRVGWRKPRAEIFEATAAALGVTADEVLHVGDKLEADVAGAAAAGMRTCWVTRRVRDVGAARGRYRGPEPDYVIADLAELTALV